MAITEQKILNQVSILPEANAINVQWINRFLRDGVVVAQQYYRKAYGQGQRQQFLDEVEGASNYVNLITW